VTLVLRFWADASVAETAEALGCSIGTVKSQTAHGLSNLRRSLGVDSVAAMTEET
jgi:DNA-directed RNA polymerase specialized sigma24 family protein